ncbi:MAG: hypothetical protein ACKOAH_28300, partial [Pirellula sp.]
MTHDFENGSSSISTRTIGWWMITLAFALQAARILGISAVNNEVPRIRAAWSANARVIIHQPMVRVEMLDEPFSKS